MTVYLVDTNVISATAPSKSVAMSDMHAWLDRNSAGLYLSVITIAELEDGIAKSRREQATRKADHLAAWLKALLHLYAPRILPLDVPAGRLMGRFSDIARGLGQAPGWADLAIAATACSRSYTILTRNLRHFTMLDVKALDPFLTLPPDVP